MAYPTMPNYMNYQPQYIAPYQDRLAQLQNQYQQTIPPQAQQVPQANQGLLWVQGEAGAKSYLVAPNTTVLLMDSESQRFYLKSTDGAGMPNLKTFEYKEVIQGGQAQAIPDEINMDDKYVTREEYNGLQRQYAEILDQISSFRATSGNEEPPKRTTTRAVPTRTKGGNSDE